MSRAPAFERVGFWERFTQYKRGVAGLSIVVGAAVVAAMAPLLTPPPYILYDDLLKPPSMAHPLGTDLIGRDVLAEMVWGTRISLLFALGVAGVALLVGVALGALPAYLGGLIDDAFSRFFEIFVMIPRFFLLILFVALFGTNIIFSMLVIGLTSWVGNARITRAQVLTLKERMFVKAGIVSGASSTQVLVRHVLPNGLYPVIANSCLQMGGAILTEAALSFLGLGDPNHISWGQLLYMAPSHMSAWWIAVFPGISIFFLVFGFNLFGDGVNYALNPRLHARPNMEGAADVKGKNG